jgi:hypothetical protein
MQRVNGADTEHETGAAAAPPPDPIAERKDLPADMMEKLKVPLPAEAVSPNPERPGLSVIKVIYVVERLNDVFGLNGWRVTNHVVENGKMVVVRATLTVPEYGITVEQYGGNDNPDRGDAYKGACTDALSKCASYLGVAMDVYKGLRDERLKSAGQNGNSGGNGTDARGSCAARSNGAGHGAGTPEPTGLTSKNMVGRFASMRTVIGIRDYNTILGGHGYSDVTNIPTLDEARDVYRALLDAFRKRYSEARRELGEAEYGKILQEQRLNPKARLSPEQAVRVFSHMWERLYGKQ